MAIRTKYSIYVLGKDAPILSTYDRVMAYVEFNDHIRNPKGLLYRMEQAPEPDGALTSSEKYLLLVYRVRKLMRKYFDGGRKHEDMLISLDYEAKLDKWNKKTKEYLDSHPGYKPEDEQAHAFYQLVSAWREAWHAKKKYANVKDCSETLLAEMRRKSNQLQGQVDKYIKEKLQLI